MNDLQIVKYQDARILTSKQLAKSYGTTTKIISYNFNYNNNKYIEGKHYYSITYNESCYCKFVNNENAKRPIYLWTFEGAIIHYNILRNVHTDRLKLVCEYFGKDYNQLVIINPISKEGEFGNRLLTVFENIIEIIPQYYIDNYRIDFYIPKYKIVIEFDEQHHLFNIDKDKQREQKLKEKLKCKLVRIDSNEKFEIALNKIMKEILINK